MYYHYYRLFLCTELVTFHLSGLFLQRDMREPKDACDGFELEQYLFPTSLNFNQGRIKERKMSVFFSETHRKENRVQKEREL